VLTEGPSSEVVEKAYAVARRRGSAGECRTLDSIRTPLVAFRVVIAYACSNIPHIEFISSGRSLPS
jgi:hypothetical protein